MGGIRWRLPPRWEALRSRLHSRQFLCNLARWKSVQRSAVIQAPEPEVKDLHGTSVVKTSLQLMTYR